MFSKTFAWIELKLNIQIESFPAPPRAYGQFHTYLLVWKDMCLNINTIFYRF